MVFTSHIFLFYFLPFVLFVYYLLPRGRNFFLLCASYVFYGWWQPWFVFLMFFATWVNYLGGIAITRPGATGRSRKLALTLSVGVSLSLLGFFKYFMFLENNLNDLLALLGSENFSIYVVTLPIGISFYIFQSLSYSVDVYRGESPPVRSFFDFACYVALFPQLIAGPIVRYNTIADQLVERDHTVQKFSSGTALFILGFAKKILLANPMGEIADSVFAANSPATIDAWFGVTAYAFQIYFDFSGYSDMAIGLGRMFGFEFLRNFNAPYLADSITDFWRRWHISLSTFLRDYLYIPLGGNRKGTRRTYLNLAIVMLLGGLWHGASWVFVIWGAYHGALLCFERWRGKESLYNSLPRPVRVAITFVLVLFSWVLFRSPDIQQAFDFFGAMFGVLKPEGGSILLAAELYTRGHLVLMAICAAFAFQPLQAFDWAPTITWKKMVILILLFLVAIMMMFVQAFNPFLYFQF
ncbi:MAG: MBOAT family protein [Candidatus Omnitrophica bacterium]|nr:MBOAT family protein [Candidatus Omnitrophota bacterium]